MKICFPKKMTFIWDKVFKNRSSKICGRQPLKHLKRQAIPLQIFRLSSTYVFWSTRECLVSYMPFSTKVDVYPEKVIPSFVSEVRPSSS